jgi:undecaprenyl-diphosphatase
MVLVLFTLPFLNLMNIFQAFVLGMVQGLGEFLPISSSAHLILVPWLAGWNDPGLAFDVALHLGTLAAVLAYFRHDVKLLVIGFWHSLSSSTRDFQNDLNQRMAWFLVVASIPGAVIGKLLEAKAETVFRSPLLIAVTLAGFGLVLLLADRAGKKQKKLAEVRLWDAILIGLSQALAIIPGVSRSGSTIAAGLGLGFQREDAARFSFLMSIPIILGAGLAHARHLSPDVGWVALSMGFLASAVFGFLSIRYLLRYVARKSFGIFVWYRFALSAVVLGLIYFGVK